MDRPNRPDRLWLCSWVEWPGLHRSNDVCVGHVPQQRPAEVCVSAGLQRSQVRHRHPRADSGDGINCVIPHTYIALLVLCLTVVYSTVLKFFQCSTNWTNVGRGVFAGAYSEPLLISPFCTLSVLGAVLLWHDDDSGRRNRALQVHGRMDGRALLHIHCTALLPWCVRQRQRLLSV